MEGFTQEIKNLAQMEFVQFWRKYHEAFPNSNKDTLNKLYCAAFISGAIAAQNLTIMSFEKVKAKFADEDL
jgi:hypothetical protein